MNVQVVQTEGKDDEFTLYLVCTAQGDNIRAGSGNQSDDSEADVDWENVGGGERLEVLEYFYYRTFTARISLIYTN